MTDHNLNDKTEEIRLSTDHIDDEWIHGRLAELDGLLEETLSKAHDLLPEAGQGVNRARLEPLVGMLDLAGDYLRTLRTGHYRAFCELCGSDQMSHSADGVCSHSRCPGEND